MKWTYTCLIILLFLSACSDQKKSAKEIPDAVKESVENVTNLKTIAVDIEGMTCEIGCARTIQSKLSKVNGVKDSKVNFESGKGYFTYDSNSISQEDIVAKISGIAGGDVYSVSAVTQIEAAIQ